MNGWCDKCGKVLIGETFSQKLDKNGKVIYEECLDCEERRVAMTEDVKEMLLNIKKICEQHEKSCVGCPFKIHSIQSCIFGMMPYAWTDEDMEEGDTE